LTAALCLLADRVSETSYRFALLQSMSEWWHWLLLLHGCVTIAAAVVAVYWFDRVELTYGVTGSLVVLRMAAFGGILFYVLHLEKRTEHVEIKPSRAILLVDTSQSMGLQDMGQSSAGSGPGLSRIDRVVSELRRGDMLRQLRARHEVAVYRFDAESEPVELAFFRRTGTGTTGTGTTSADQGAAALGTRARSVPLPRALALAALAAGVLSAAAFLLYLFLGRGPAARPWMSLTHLLSTVALITAVVLLAAAHLCASDLPLREVAGLRRPEPPAGAQAQGEQTKRGRDESADTQAVEPDDVPWQTKLSLEGSATRIGDAVRAIVNKERGGPIAGIVLVTDGRGNAGLDTQAAAAAAETAGVPVFAVGLGSTEEPLNVRVVDLEAPKRVYPGDKFTVTGYLRAFGLEGRAVTIELASGPVAGDSDASPEEMLEEERSVRLAADGEIVTVRFQVSPADVGTRQYALQVKPPEEDIDPRDNRKTARVNVVARRTRVLLIAGGPAREYQYLRNMLFRDENNTTVDVLLQSGEEGMAQEASDVLYRFPATAEELFEYDAIVAFDADWLRLDELQVASLERWVADQAGGLVVIAGPVHTPEWSAYRRGRDARVDTIKALYPVIFYTQGSPNLSLGRFGGAAAWPLSFSDDGRAAEFLWLEDDALDSESAWQSFEGVYGYYAVKDPKPGARVYARFSNPETSLDGELPVYAAAHFYGAGRVFFQASGEMWRLRGVAPRYFDTYYTKLIRWAAQGRLARDSSRGVLLVDKDRCLLGDAVTVRAVLNDAQDQPLALDAIPALLVQPDGKRSPLELRKIQDAAREGRYQAEFLAQAEGDYRVELTPPGSTNELLTAEVRVRLPALEMERPQRDDATLTDLARKTGGEYFVGFDAAMNRPGGSPRATLASVVQPNDKAIPLPVSTDRGFAQRLRGWLLVLICGALCLEWLTRRLSKLA